MLESVKESGYVSKYKRTGELSLEGIKMIFSPVHQSSPPVQSSDCRLPLGVRLCSIHKVKKHNLKIRGEDGYQH